MHPPDIPQDEAERLDALRALEILDTAGEERFDRVTRLARRLFGVPIALVSLVDENRQWFKSRQGLDATETPREISFCGHAIHKPEIFEVPDASSDERFHDNPLVVGDPKIRFYAGCPLAAPGGQRVGTLCLIDQTPRTLSQEDRATLRDLAAMVESELAALRLATNDELTGLSNRRGFEELARFALADAKRNGAPLTLVFLDLDRFKEINDSHGHAEGDRALVEMSRLLLASFRDSDVVARLGGDEFCVLLRQTGDGDLKSPLERLESALAERNAAPGVTWKLGFSAGSASYDPSSHGDVQALIAEADQRMYEHKMKRRRSRS